MRPWACRIRRQSAAVRSSRRTTGKPSRRADRDAANSNSCLGAGDRALIGLHEVASAAVDLAAVYCQVDSSANSAEKFESAEAAGFAREAPQCLRRNHDLPLWFCRFGAGGVWCGVAAPARLTSTRRSVRTTSLSAKSSWVLRSGSKQQTGLSPGASCDSTCCRQSGGKVIVFDYFRWFRHVMTVFQGCDGGRSLNLGLPPRACIFRR